MGSDTNNGLSESTPVKTITKGKSLMRNSYPDWILLKKGDTWTDEAFGQFCYSGRSKTEPMLISAYGAGARPLIKTNPSISTTNGIMSSSGGGCGIGGDYLAIVGLEFYAYTRDPNSPNFNPSTLTITHSGFNFLYATNWQLLEDNKFSFYSGNTIHPWPTGPTFKNISLRRNIITDDYVTNGYCQGLFSSGTSDFLVEENVWDHNGWNEQVTGTSTMFSRNMYLSHGDGKTILRGNIDANGASGGVQVRTGGIAENNLFLRDPYSITFGHNQNDTIDISGVIRNNVILDSRDINNTVGNGAGTGIWIRSELANVQGSSSYGDALVKNLDVYGNIIAHNKLGSLNIAGIKMDGTGPYANTKVHNNIIYDWSRPTWPTATDHRADGLYIKIATSTLPAEVSVYNNIIQQIYSGFIGLTSNIDTASSSVLRQNNTYWSAEANSAVVWSKGWFEFFGEHAVTWDMWMTRTGETGAVNQLVGFTDPNRSIETYMTSLGVTPTYEAFMVKARQQSKDNWDPRFTASVVNNYIRAGFDLPPLP